MAFRLIHRITLSLPNLPPRLEGMRIAHLSDLHIERRRTRHRRIILEMAAAEVDLVLLTGDYMSNAGDESHAIDVMRELIAALRPRLGTYGVFGNHDTPELADALADQPVTWLRDDRCHRADDALEVVGVHTDRRKSPDVLALIARLNHTNGHGNGSPGGADDRDGLADAPTQPSRRLRLMLSHLPTFLPTAADLGMDVMFSGHTHGGQCRLPSGRALINSTDLPLRLTSGLLRHRDTICVVSRGLGEVHLPLRVFCPPHLPVYTLRSGPMHGRYTHHIENVQPW